MPQIKTACWNINGYIHKANTKYADAQFFENLNQHEIVFVFFFYLELIVIWVSPLDYIMIKLYILFDQMPKMQKAGDISVFKTEVVKDMKTDYGNTEFTRCMVWLQRY